MGITAWRMGRMDEQYIIMSIFFTLSICIHFITVHPKLHVKPKDIDPNDLGGSRRLLHKKVIVPGLHKTGPDRFDDCDAQVDFLNDNQEEMNDCLDDILRLLGGPDPYQIAAIERGLLEDRSNSSSPTTAMPLELHIKEEMWEEEEEEKKGGTEGCVDGAPVALAGHGPDSGNVDVVHRTLTPINEFSPAQTAVNLQYETLPRPAGADPDIFKSAKLEEEASGTETRKALPLSAPSGSEPPTTLTSPMRTGNTGRKNLLRRLGVSSDKTKRSSARSDGKGEEVARSAEKQSPEGDSSPFRSSRKEVSWSNHHQPALSSSPTRSPHDPLVGSLRHM